VAQNEPRILVPIPARCRDVGYVAQPNMWRKADPGHVLFGIDASCATYLRGYSDRRNSITSGFRDQPPDTFRVRPRSNVANARFLVARSVSA
jgi:hypothetical protein